MRTVGIGNGNWLATGHVNLMPYALQDDLVWSVASLYKPDQSAMTRGGSAVSCTSKEIMY